MSRKHRGGVEVQLHSLLTSALDRGVMNATIRPPLLAPEGPSIHFNVGSVVPRANWTGSRYSIKYNTVPSESRCALTKGSDVRVPLLKVP
jgi:hypothetical protein